MIIEFFQEKTISENWKEKIANVVGLIFFNNFITLFYYFIGLVFFITINKKISIFFMELGFHDSEFYVLVFLIFPAILIIFLVPIIYFIQNFKHHGLYILFDCVYKKGFEKMIFLHYMLLFFVIIFSHYSYLAVSYAIFAKNLYMIYLTLMSSLNFFESTGLKYLKMFSAITIIVSFVENYEATICLNCIFYGILFAFTIFIRFFSGKKTAKKETTISNTLFTHITTMKWNWWNYEYNYHSINQNFQLNRIKFNYNFLTFFFFLTFINNMKSLQKSKLL